MAHLHGFIFLIHFRATIALEKSTYWMNITSDALVAKYPTEPPYVTSASTSTRSTTGAPLYLTFSNNNHLSGVVTLPTSSGDDDTTGDVFDKRTYIVTETNVRQRNLTQDVVLTDTTPEYKVTRGSTVSRASGKWHAWRCVCLNI